MNTRRDENMLTWWADVRVLVLLFFGLRLTLAVVYQPALWQLYDANGAPLTLQQGLSTYGDFHYFYNIARLTDGGNWPYRDFWYEFPPLWSVLFMGLYRVLSVHSAASYATWSTALGLLLNVFDVGNLVLLRRLGERLHGQTVGLALSWTYALLAAPLILTWWNFEPLVLFLMLAALWTLLSGAEGRSALLTALGALTKYVPILLLPTVWRFWPRTRALRYTLVSVGLVALMLGGLLVWGGEMAWASLRAQAVKPSYQTVWALLDGNLRTGQFPDAAAHFDTRTIYDTTAYPPRVPFGLRTLPFVALGAWLYTRQMRRDAHGVVAFYALTVTLFFLWAQGWSAQWALPLSALILLNFPTRAGVLSCLMLGLLSFWEYPALFMRATEAASVVRAHLVPTFALLVSVRTVLLLGFAAALYRRLTSFQTEER